MRVPRFTLIATVFIALAVIVAICLRTPGDPLDSPPVSEMKVSLGGVVPTSPASAPGLIGWINNTIGGSAVGNWSAVEHVLNMQNSPSPLDGQRWDLAEGIAYNTTGVMEFQVGSDPDFPTIASLLTDGLEQLIRVDFTLVNSTTLTGAEGYESYYLGRDPDLVGYEVDSLRRNITFLNLTHSNGITDFFETSTWEVWGHPLFVFFVPPTDPDGAYLIDRNRTEVQVRLVGAGVAVLEWDGANRSMVFSESSWSAAPSGLGNGEYSYRVWASNATGTVYATPVRSLTVGVGIRRMERVGIGGWPSIAVNATGYPRMCYYGGFLAYAERLPSGWINTSIAGGGAGCSLALDSRGRPHIGFQFFTYDWSGVGYAYPNSTGWSATHVDPVPNAQTSIAISPVTDEPMISYGDNVDKGLRLATFSEGRWGVQIVDSSFYGETTSLAIDPSGRPAIAYTDYTAATLQVARWTGSQWAITTLETGVTDASIKFDASGIPHVAYASRSGLSYATWDGTMWNIESVDRGRYFGVSLDFDSFGRPHIGYSMGYGGDVRQVVNDGDWKIQVVSHGNGNGQATLAVMPQGSAVAFSPSDPGQNLEMATDFVDPQAPRSFVFLNGTSESAGVYVSPVTVRLEAEDEWSGIASIEYRLDGELWTEYDQAFQVSSDGRHVLDYRATDGAGNVEPFQTVEFVIDMSPFSFSGPYRGLATIVIIQLSVAVAFALAIWFYGRKRKLAPPSSPPDLPKI